MPFAPDFSAAPALPPTPTRSIWLAWMPWWWSAPILFWFLTAAEINDLKARRVPVVVLSPFANRTTGHAEVVIPVALAGLETPEVAFRMDGLPLYLPEIISSPLWPDSQVLRTLTAAL